VFDAKEGTVTAANASQISDGGAAVAVASMQKAEERSASSPSRIVDLPHLGVVAQGYLPRSRGQAVPARDRQGRP
jgi:acetyl-CoA acetyltransferase